MIEANADRSRCTFDVLTVADICVDMILTGNVRPQFHQVEQIVDDCSLELGGSATIFATQLAKLKARVGVIGWVGKDVLGQFVLQQLAAAGVDTQRVREHLAFKTGVGVALSEKNDRAILTYPGTIDATRPEDLQERWLGGCKHWHIASYFLLQNMRAIWPDWLAKCRGRGITTSLDTNWDPEARWLGVQELLPLVDIFLPNEEEALAISGERNPFDAGKRLASSGPLVVIKRGENGALAMLKNKTWEFRPDQTELPSFIVDATGAGDNFDAGFIRAWLLGRDMETCLRLGHRCGLNSLKFLGGTRGQVVDNVEACQP